MKSLFIFPNQNNALLTWRRESLGGKDYIVAQGVPLVEGVLNGRFVSAEEFGAFINDWNGVPVVMRHPKENGGSARVPKPDVPVIGKFYGAKLDGKRLVGEYWLEADQLDNPDGEMVLSRISAQKPSETSTGYWAESIPSVGNWNGRDFAFVDQNIHPDHIALLPDEIGACSLEDGCGMNRNAKQKGGPMPTSRNLHKNADGSLEQRMNEVYEAFTSKYRGSGDANTPMSSEAPYITSTFDSYIVVKVDGNFYQVGYARSGDEITFDPREQWTEVLRVEKYVPIQQNVTGLTGRAAKLWEEVYQSYIDKKYSEERAAKAAWSAVTGAYEKNDEGEWVKKNQQDLELVDIAPQELEGLTSLVALVAD